MLRTSAQRVRRTLRISIALTLFMAIVATGSTSPVAALTGRPPAGSGHSATPGAARPSPSPTPGQTGSASIALRSETFAAMPDREIEFQIDVALGGDLNEDDLSVVVSEAQGVTSRTSVAAINAGSEKASYRIAATVPLNKLPKTSGTTRTLKLRTVIGGASNSGSGEIAFPSEGVYPLTLSIHRSAEARGQALATIQTWVAFVTRNPERPLQTALTWPMNGTAPGHDIDGAPSDAFRHDVALGGRLRRAATLAAYSPIPLTLIPVPEMLSDLATAAMPSTDSASDATGLRSDAGLTLDTIRATSHRPGFETLAIPYSQPPASVFTDPAFTADSALQSTLGPAVAAQTLGPAPTTDLGIAPEGPTDEKVVHTLVESGASRLLLRESSLKPAPGTTGQLFAIEGPGELISAIAPDPDLSRQFSEASDETKPEVAYRALADIAAIYFESEGSTRGLVISPDPEWGAPESFSSLVLAGIASSPFLKPASVQKLFDEVPAATGRRRGPVIREFTGDHPGPVPQAEAFQAANTAAAGFESILVEPNPLPWALRLQILAAQSSRSLTGDGLRAHALLGSVTDRVGDEISLIRIPPSNSITLTAKDGVVPFRVENAASYPVRVTLDLQSEKLRFPDNDFGTPFTVIPPGQSQDIRIIADSTGVFPMDAALRSPDQSFVVSEARLSVRSTGAGRAALIITLVAAGILIAWWGREFFRSRSRRRADN